MKKFRCTVTKMYEYEIEIDNKVWTPDKIAEWAYRFQKAEDIEDIAKIVAQMKTNYKNGEFIEGFGIPYINGKSPLPFGENEKLLAPDINITETYAFIGTDSMEMRSGGFIW